MMAVCNKCERFDIPKN